MKILQINCVYKKGSTGKITYDLHNYYKENGVDSYVIYGRGEKVKEENVYKVSTEFFSKLRNVFSRFDGNLYGKGSFSLQKIKRIIKKEKFDIVHLQCINGYFVNIYKLVEFLKKNDIKTVLTLHAEFMYTANCGYSFECEKWIKGECTDCDNSVLAIGSKNKKATHKNFVKMKKAFDGFEKIKIVGVSKWVAERAKLSPIFKGKDITCVFNGLDDKVFNYKNIEENEEFSKLFSEGKKSVFYLSPYFEDENKGGKYLLEIAKKAEGQDINFIVGGNKSQDYPEYKNIAFLGQIKDVKTLAYLYSKSDVTLLTSKRETFSMVTAESLCSGTPVVGFKAGGPETIAIEEYSKFTEYGNVELLYNSVLEFLNKKFDKEKISELAVKKYATETMAKNYIKIYNEMLEKYGKD